jgi:thiosulfate dehydrogenase (quinone) large subunit
MARQIIIEESPAARFLFSDTRVAWFWFLLRIYVGWEWRIAGWEKVNDPAWTGPNAGGALGGFKLRETIGYIPLPIPPSVPPSLNSM